MLTQEQFQTLHAVRSKVAVVQVAAASLAELTDRVLAASDPDNPFNVDMTMTRVLELRDTLWSEKTTALETAVGELP